MAPVEIKTRSQVIRAEVIEVINFVNELPEEFRLITYESLLKEIISRNSLSADVTIAKSIAANNQDLGEQGAGAVDFPVKLTPTLRGFLGRTKFNLAKLQKIAMIEDGQMVYFRTPAIKPKSRATLEWALLIAFKNGVSGGEFAVSKQLIRETCKLYNCYDDSNFSAIVRDVSSVFSGSLDDTNAKRVLTPDGERSLVDLVDRLADD